MKPENKDEEDNVDSSAESVDPVIHKLLWLLQQQPTSFNPSCCKASAAIAAPF